MKLIRHIGSLAFVLGLFIVIFFGIPWHMLTSVDPVIPLWLRIAVFGLLGGILLVLLTVALERRKASVWIGLPASKGVSLASKAASHAFWSLDSCLQR